MFVKITDNIYCSYIIVDRRHENSITSEVTFFYKEEENFKEVQKIVEELNSCTLIFDEDESNNLNTIALSATSGLEIEPIDMSDFDVDNFDLFYTKNTSKDINKLVKEIKKADKGLSILYGERGTGKTSVINYLASKLDRIVIFIPNNMIEHTINNPEFRKFLKRYSKPVIVIDDCEMMFHEYFTKSNMFVNNLLQMVDGFLSDSMEVNVVAIFNVDDEDEIDHSLLESNNLLRVVEFSELSEDESSELSDYLGHKKQYKNKTNVLNIIKNRKPKDSKEFGL
jgi:Cdc6-like AAA superfamily ATPase